MTDNSHESALQAVRTLIAYIGDNPDRPGLRGTPERVLKAWKNEWGSGYSQPEPSCTAFKDIAYDQMVMVRNIPYWSHCEHHLAPFFGNVTIGYIPDEERGVVGLSKLARVVNHYARRLQVQERLTNDITEFVFNQISTNGVGVLVSGRHLCMESRGVSIHGSTTITSSLMGEFFDGSKARAEFLALSQIQT